MCGSADVERIKNGCQCGGYPPFTHRTQARLWTNKQCITVY